MKRGIFRVIAGIIMILLQLLSIIGLSLAGTYYISADIWYNIGYYGVGITGIILLIFGINAYKKGLQSQLVLHGKSGKSYTIIKWVMFVITALLFLGYLVSFIKEFDAYQFLMIFATLSFAVYLLFYIYKKPSCLPSTSLIFVGISYLYHILSNIRYYIVNLPKFDFTILMVTFSIIPEVIAGVLYFVLASQLYNEKFSVKVIKTIGWIVFAMEISNRIIYPVLMCIKFGYVYYFYDLANILSILFVLGLLLYVSAFRINTLKQQKMCNTSNMVRFCRKCGNALLVRAKFCNKCGTEVIYKIGDRGDEM